MVRVWPLRSAARLVAVAASIAFSALGCSSSERPGLSAAGDIPTTGVAGKGAPCVAGATRACSVELGTYNGVVSCIEGSQTCDQGAWTACKTDSTSKTYQVVAPPPNVAGLHAAAIGGASTDCANDPCDPYCRVFTDTPNAPITTTPTITTIGTTGGSLASSNVPPAFKTKGSLDSRCTTPCTAQSCMEACQFDQYCGTLSGGAAGCVAFGDLQSGACNGVDITVPTTCVPSAGFRDVTVCNRGTLSAPAGVQCFTFPGGSPQYPDSSPSLSHATLVMTTQTTIQPGKCETQQIPESAFGSNGIKSLMCNPPGSGAGAFITETSAGTHYPTSDVDSGWTNDTRGYAADGSYATALLGHSTAGPQYPSSFSGNSGWNNPNYTSAADGASATAMPPITGTVSDRFPSANTTSSWTNAAYAYVAGEANAAQRYATAAPSLPALGPSVSTGAKFPTTNTSNACNNGNGCAWQTPNNVYAKESPPAPSASYMTATLSQSAAPDSTSIYFGGFDFSSVPVASVIQSITVTTHWGASNKIGTMTVQAYNASGTAIGTPITHAGTCNSSSTYDETVSQTSNFAAGAVTRADITGSKFIKVTATHCANSSNDAAKVDYVTVSVTYQGAGTPNTSTLTLGNFGINVPAGAAITGVTTEAKWHVSAANANLTLGLQPFVQGGATALGSELTTTATLGLTSDTVASTAAPAAAVSALQASDLADGTFVVQVRATRTNPADGSSNPDVTAYLDYVKVSVSYTLGSSNYSVTLGNFGISIPAGATVLSATTEVQWSADTTNPNVSIGAQPQSGTTSIGSELSVISPPTTPTVASATVTSKSDGSAIVPADLADGTFTVKLRATRSASAGANPDTTVSVDYVRVTVAYTVASSDRVLYQGFGFSVPPARDLMSLKAEAKWRISASNPNVVLGFQAYKDNGLTPLGSETTTTLGSSPPTTDTVVTSAVDLSNVTATDLDDPGFGVIVRATHGAGLSPNPDVTAYLDYVTLTATYATPSGGNLPECNPYNNWSATKAVPSPDACLTQQVVKYPPFTQTRVFQATCGYATGPRWSYFAYHSATPGDSKIAFRFRTFAPTGSPPTCVALPPVTSDPPTAVVTAHSTPTNTQNCPADGSVPGCPVDLHYSLGANNTACLQMDAQGTPASDGSAAPTLDDWTVFYDCITNQ